MAKEITKDTTLEEILKAPGGERILRKYNFPCLGCSMAKFEMKSLKIGEVCETYNLYLDKILKDLNEKIKK